VAARVGRDLRPGRDRVRPPRLARLRQVPDLQFHSLERLPARWTRS